MKLKWVTKSLIKDINDFLTYNKYNKKTLKELRPENETISVDEIVGDIADSNSKEKISIIKRKIVSYFITFWYLSQDPDNRENSSEMNFFVYNHKADYFRDFRISNFNVMMNDKKELKWFDKYVGLKISEANEWRKNGYTLVKCTTTTQSNKKYMAANYNIIPDVGGNINYDFPFGYRQYAAIYEGNKVLQKFDSLNSSNLKNIRGFVRYLSKDKNLALEFILKLYIEAKENESLSKILTDDLFKFMFSILSFFIKGECMSKEEEFRFLLISEGNKIKEISIYETPLYQQTFYATSDLRSKINPEYRKSSYFGGSGKPSK